jgi:predicted amidophosphoribosyltransferase
VTGLRPEEGTCDECHREFEPSRSDAVFCSHRCRQRSYRARRRAEATYEAQQLDAEAAAAMASLEATS